jgi:hypothetical protein
LAKRGVQFRIGGGQPRRRPHRAEQGRVGKDSPIVDQHCERMPALVNVGRRPGVGISGRGDRPPGDVDEAVVVRLPIAELERRVAQHPRQLTAEVTEWALAELDDEVHDGGRDLSSYADYESDCDADQHA